MELSNLVQEAGTILAWVAFVLGGGIAYGKLSTAVDEIKYDVTSLRDDFKKFTEDHNAFKLDTGSRLGAIRRSQDEK